MSAMDPALFDVTPALKSPDGVYNFENPENIFPLIRFTIGICLAVCSFFVILRIWTRFFLVKTDNWEDYTIVIAWLGLIAYGVLGLEALKYGSGVHQWNVTLTHFFEFLRLANILEIFYNPLIFVTKLSILLQYKRIFCPHGSGWSYRMIWLLIGFNALFYVAIMIPQIAACSPREKIWHPLIEGHCLDLPSILISGACVNIVSDFSILLLPLYKIWHLQLSTVKKIGVSSVFGTGLFACLSSVLRLVNNVQFAHTQDVTWDLTPVALWTFAEISSGIICGCLPIAPLFFKQITPSIKSKLSSWVTKKTQDQTEENSLEGGSGYHEGPYIELNDQTKLSSTQ